MERISKNLEFVNCEEVVTENAINEMKLVISDMTEEARTGYAYRQVNTGYRTGVSLEYSYSAGRNVTGWMAAYFTPSETICSEIYDDPIEALDELLQFV